MATYAAPVPQVAAHRAEREPRGWTSWITTTDHKRIGIMYMVTTFVFFCLGGVEALMIRLQLGAAEQHAGHAAVYNQLFTMHGTTMVFLFVVPMMAGLANYFLPLMIGARDMAFPRLNALSYWLLLAGGHRVLRLDLLEPAGSGLDELRAAVRASTTRPAAARTRGST